jgi:hypothetical protein
MACADGVCRWQEIDDHYSLILPRRLTEVRKDRFFPERQQVSGGEGRTSFTLRE